MSDKVFNVLFLCTHNSARSVLSECILNRRGEGRFRAFSAGSAPRGAVNPLALELLNKEGYDTSGLRSKSWDEFAATDAPALDLVVTVCDAAAAEACPIWPGHPLTTHWGVPDPSAATGSEAERRAAFERAYLQLETRIEKFLTLPFDSLDTQELKERLAAIGSMDAETSETS
jgi:arsenate reductase (thioredoxin)